MKRKIAKAGKFALTRLVHFGDWLSAGVNSMFLLGCNQESVSGRCFRESVLEGKRGWQPARKAIDWIFSPFEADHCRKSYFKDYDRAAFYKHRHYQYMERGRSKDLSDN